MKFNRNAAFPASKSGHFYPGYRAGHPVFLAIALAVSSPAMVKAAAPSVHMQISSSLNGKIILGFDAFSKIAHDVAF